MSAAPQALPFGRIAEVALTQALNLLREWFPNGKLHGHEYRVGSINGEPGQSFAVNVQTGRWGEFNGAGPTGRDLLGLCAAKFHGGNIADAARELGQRLGVLNERRIAETYDYQDEAGTLQFQVVRLIPKDFRQRRPDGKGGWIWKLGDVRRVLYRLPELLTADPSQPVFVVEGEKDVERLRPLGLVATTNPGGAGKWRDEYSGFLKNRDTILLPDNDQAGTDHMAAVARSLAGIARSVRTVCLPGLADKGDVSDWLDAGGTKEELLRLAREQSPPRIRRIRTGDAFVASFEPPDWLIDGIIQRGRLYACTSLTGHGKTAVWLHNACMIHAGRKIGHLEVQPGNVLILAGENPEDLKARMLGMCRQYGLPSMQLPYVLPATFPMSDDEADVLRRDIAALGVPFALIIGDTAASFFPGEDENDNVSAGHYARTLRSLTECPGNPAVVLLSHPVKNARHDNLLPRGGGAFLNELDGNLTLWSAEAGEVTSLHWQGKIRGPDFNPVTYRLKQVWTGYQDNKGRDVMTVVATPISEEEAADRSKQRAADEDAVLRALRDNHHQSYAQIARDAGWLGKNDEPQRWKVQRAIEKLAEDKLVHQPRSGKGWKVSRQGVAYLDEDDDE